MQVDDGKTKVDGEKGLAVLHWQIKDFKEGAEVIFHYRQKETGKFEAVPAQNIGDGLFEAEIPFEIRVEPFWEIGVSKRIVGGTAVSQHTVERPRADYQSVSYYVSMKTGDVTRSSEIARVDVAYLAKIKYAPIVGNVDINNNKYHISLYEHTHNANRFETIMARFYNGSRIVAEKVMEVKDNAGPSKTYSLTYDAGSQDISHLVIIVKYTNGKTFEKKFY